MNHCDVCNTPAILATKDGDKIYQFCATCIATMSRMNSDNAEHFGLPESVTGINRWEQERIAR